MVPDAPYHYACDAKWWDKHYDSVKQGFKGKSYTINDIYNENINPDVEYDLIRVNSTYGEDLGDNVLHYGVPGGGNSGFQAVNLAYLLGAKTIILLGFDMFGTHYFGPHEGLSNDSPYPRFMESFETITKVEVINCTRQTALNCFPKMSLESVLSSAPDPA